MEKGLHKVFMDVLNELNNTLPDLVQSVSKVSHFIPEPRNLAEVTKLPADFKKAWSKATLNQIKSSINTQTFLTDDPEKGDTVTPCMNV